MVLLKRLLSLSNQVFFILLPLFLLIFRGIHPKQDYESCQILLVVLLQFCLLETRCKFISLDNPLSSELITRTEIFCVEVVFADATLKILKYFIIC